MFKPDALQSPSCISCGLTQSCLALRSERSSQSDPVLSFVASSLVSTRAAASPATLAGSALHPEVQRWLVQWDDIAIIRPIGRGSFGRVYLALWNETSIACKVMISADAKVDQQSLDLIDATVQELQKEAAVMAQMRHPNVVNLLGLCTLPPCILTGKGSLASSCRGAESVSE